MPKMITYFGERCYKYYLQLYTALPSRCTSYSHIKTLTLVYYILSSGDLHFIQLKLYIAMISIDLISLISKIHICLKVYIFRYNMVSRFIFFSATGP